MGGCGGVVGREGDRINGKEAFGLEVFDFEVDAFDMSLYLVMLRIAISQQSVCFLRVAPHEGMEVEEPRHRIKTCMKSQ